MSWLRLLCAERGDHPVRSDRKLPRDLRGNPRRPGGAPAGRRRPGRPEAPTFAELGIDPRIVEALAEVGIERTFAIQALTLPHRAGRHDLIGQARTGMGKTLGFGVPLLQRLARAEARRDDKGKLPAGRAPRALVMVPTRELCVQVTRDLHRGGQVPRAVR